MAICEGDCQVMNLEIGCNNLSRVNTDILARTVVTHEDVGGHHTLHEAAEGCNLCCHHQGRLLAKEADLIQQRPVYTQS